MTRPPVIKRMDEIAGANMPSYAAAVANFSWEAARMLLDGLPGGGLNIAYEAIDRHVVDGRGGQSALRWLAADGRVVDFSYEDLRRQTNRFANVLRKLGVSKGERVYSLLGRTPELHIAALGALKAGAAFCPLFSAFGPEPIRSRMEIGEASVLVTLRDNLYYPLGGNRKGPVRTSIKLALVMLLGGLWHGASWNFVIWGAIHGLMLILERLGGKHAFYERLPKVAKVAITFVIVCFTWVFFRAADLPAAVEYCRSMLGLTTPQSGAGLIGGLIYQPYYVVTMLLAAIVVWFCPQTWDFTRKITWKKALWITGVFWLAIVAMTTQEFNPFIYFMF